MSAPPAVRERIVDVGELAVTLLEATDVDRLLDAAVEEGGPAPYGVVLWASAVTVARRLVAEGDLSGRRVVDVGAGTGLGALTAAHLGAEVLALDVDEKPLRLLEDAAARQGLRLVTAPFDILEREPLPPGDLILFADLLYEPVLARACAERVLEAHARGSEVLVGDPERAFRDTFSTTLTKAGVPARFEIDAVRLPGDARSQRVGLLHLRPAPAPSSERRS